MISRDKMFIIASNLDDSIKSQTTVYDITLFKTFNNFERYINNFPVVVDTIVISSDELSFNSTNMQRIETILSSPFLKLTGNVVYLADNDYDIKMINRFFTDNKWDNWVVYQGDLSVKFITEIVTGEGRQTTEVQSETVVYRMRASDYLKQKASEAVNTESTNKYLNDEDLLAGIPLEEEIEEEKPRVDVRTTVNYIVGSGIERTVMVFLLAQYRALKGKVLIVEKDWEYHSLTELVTKAQLPCQLIYVEDLIKDVSTTIDIIKRSRENMIVIGCRNRSEFSYNFIMDILESNLTGELSYIIRECDYNETPYGKNYVIVTSNTVPAVLKCCNSLKYPPKKGKVTFIGMQLNELGPVNITSKEMSAIISTVLESNDIPAHTIKVEGIHLKGENTAYDILGIIGRDN